MGFKRKIFSIIALALSFLGIFGAAGVSAFAAQAQNGPETEIAEEAAAAAQAEGFAETVTAGRKGYTPYELCCMAQYYFKRTSADGSYPPEADCEEQKDGTYLITLRKKIDDGDGKFHYTTYAWYNVDSSAKGTDTFREKAIDLTLYSKVYTPEELCKQAQEYYYRKYDFYPPNAQYTANTDGTYTINLYEVMKDEGGVEHIATCGWFTVNVCGVGTDDIMLEAVDINL